MSKGIHKCQFFDTVWPMWPRATVAKGYGIVVLATLGCASLCPPAYTLAIPREALSSSYSLWLHWCSSAARTASRHRSRNTPAPSQKHSRAKVPEPLAMHALSAKSYRLDDSRGQRLKRTCDKLIIDENEHVFVFMVRYMPAGAISFDIVLAGTFYFRMLSARASNSERAIAMLYEFK